MKRELTALREQLVDKSKELEVGGTNFLWLSGLRFKKVSFLCGIEQDMSPVALATGV